MILYLTVFAISTLVGAVGALFVKRGSATFSLHPLKLIRNTNLIIGGALYVLASATYVWLLQFLPLSVAYPLTSMGYIWVTLLSWRVLREDVNIYRWMGVLLIVVGITVVSL